MPHWSVGTAPWARWSDRDASKALSSGSLRFYGDPSPSQENVAFRDLIQSRTRWKVTAIKLFQHPCGITTTDEWGITISTRFLLTGTCPVPTKRDRRGQGAQYKMKLPCREAPPCLPRPKGWTGNFTFFNMFLPLHGTHCIKYFLKSCFPLLLFNGSFQMEINKNHFATMSIGRLEINYQFWLKSMQE